MPLVARPALAKVNMKMLRKHFPYSVVKSRLTHMAVVVMGYDSYQKESIVYQKSQYRRGYHLGRSKSANEKVIVSVCGQLVEVSRIRTEILGVFELIQKSASPSKRAAAAALTPAKTTQRCS